jgi:glycerophosphoryl diester phosphodiesterase
MGQDGPVDPAAGISARLPLGFAHRGARAECRDNTLASFRRALELGAAALESDVWLTADGVAVLDHDGVVRRGVRRAAIRTLPRSALPHHILALGELYDRCGSEFDLSLDMKDPAAIDAVLAAAPGPAALDRLWLCGSGADLVAWRSRSDTVHLVESTALARIPEGVAARAAHLRDTGVEALNLRWPEWDRSAVEAVHAAGALAFAWDAQRVAVIAALVALGVDGVYSDHVGRMGRALRHPTTPIP